MPPMIATLRRPKVIVQDLDRLAIGISGLCMVHCLATAVFLGLLASAGGLLGSPWIHEVGLTLAMVLGAVALGRGIFEHGFMMPSAVGGPRAGRDGGCADHAA